MRFLSALLASLAFATSAASAQQSEANPAPAFEMQRCVNMGNSLDGERGSDWRKSINPSDFLRIKAAGFDTVRIPARWGDYSGPAPDYLIEPAFMAEVDAAVQAALAADLKVILNIHHFNELMEDPRGEMKKLLAMWRQIAPHFADAPDRLWFEALNEPSHNLNGDLMRAAQTTSVLAIRESNPDRIIILGGEEWSGLTSLPTNIAPPDSNIVYTFHYYDPFDFTHQYADWLEDEMPTKKRSWGSRRDKEELEAAAEYAAAFREAVGHPVFVGEFGANDPINAKDRVKWAGAVRAAMEDKDIPWCLWSFSNTFALYDADTGWDEDMVEALGVNVPSDLIIPERAPRFDTQVQKASDVTGQDEEWGTYYQYFEGASWGTENALSGIAEIQPGKEIHPPHTHAEEEYLMVLEGAGTWSVNGETFPAGPGDMLYAAPWDEHGISNTGDTVLKFVFWKWTSSGLTPPPEPAE